MSVSLATGISTSSPRRQVEDRVVSRAARVERQKEVLILSREERATGARVEIRARYTDHGEAHLPRAKGFREPGKGIHPS